MPLVIAFALWAAMMQQMQRADAEVHLIPAGYVGEVTIVFNAPNGEPLDIEDGARLYRIPLTGILFTQLAINEGHSPEQRFFLVAPNGDRQPITQLSGSVADLLEERANPTVGIFSQTRGQIQAGLTPCAIDFEQYFVGTRAQLLDRSDASSGRITKYLQDTFKCP
jgi:hypothetical protein